MFPLSSQKQVPQLIQTFFKSSIVVLESISKLQNYHLLWYLLVALWWDVELWSCDTYSRKRDATGPVFKGKRVVEGLVVLITEPSQTGREQLPSLSAAPPSILLSSPCSDQSGTRVCLQPATKSDKLQIRSEESYGAVPSVKFEESMGVFKWSFERLSSFLWPYTLKKNLEQNPKSAWSDSLDNNSVRAVRCFVIVVITL